MHNNCCSDGIYKFYSLVTFASYAVVADVEVADVEVDDVEVADVEVADVEMADVEMVDVEMVEGVVFLLQLALDRTMGCSMLLCFCGMDTEDLLSGLMLAVVKTDFTLDLYSFFLNDHAVFSYISTRFKNCSSNS